MMRTRPGGPGCWSKWPIAEVEQVGRHRGGGGEHQGLVVPRPGLLHHGRVEHHVEVGGDRKGEPQRRLAIGSVDAGEDPTCVRRGALCREDVPVPVAGPVESHESPRHDPPLERDPDRGVPGRDRREDDHLLLRSALRRGGRPIDGRVPDREPHGVEDDGSLHRTKVRLEGAVERQGREIDFEIETVLRYLRQCRAMGQPTVPSPPSRELAIAGDASGRIRFPPGGGEEVARPYQSYIPDLGRPLG